MIRMILEGIFHILSVLMDIKDEVSGSRHGYKKEREYMERIRKEFEV